MSNTAIKGSALPSVASLVGNSKIIVVDGATSNSKYVTVANLLGNTAANVAVRATRLLANVAPANSSANGVLGDVGFDSSFFYICVSTNTWRRVAISTW